MWTVEPRLSRLQRQTPVRVGAVLLLLATCLVCAAGVAPAAHGAPSPDSLLNRPLPQFRVTDISGPPIQSRTLRGRNTVLLAFCTCEACHVLARAWAEAQRSSALRARRSDSCETVAVYAADAPAARTLAARAGLDTLRTRVASDPEMTVARTLRALPCPAVFIIDRGGIVRYASKEMTGGHPAAPAVIVAQTQRMLAAMNGAHGTSKAGAVPSTLPTITGPTLTPLPAPGLRVIDGNGLLWDAGVLPLPLVVRSFGFRNDTKTPIEVVSVQGSCGCGTTTLTQGGAAVASTVVRPGETVQVWVSATLRSPGTKHVFAWLYGRALNVVGFAKMTVSRSP